MLFKKQTKKYPATLWEKLFAPAIFLLLATIALILTAFNFETIDYRYPIKLDNAKTTIISDSINYVINSGYTIAFKKPSFIKSFLYPDHFMTDTFYQLCCIIICIIIITIKYKEHKRGIFTAKLSKYTKVLAIIFMVIFFLNSFRWTYLSHQISKITNNSYRIDFISDQFYKPELWLFLVLGIITQILKKAEDIQQEQDLTI